jgi:AraC-like DNA-binding protein
MKESLNEKRVFSETQPFPVILQYSTKLFSRTKHDFFNPGSIFCAHIHPHETEIHFIKIGGGAYRVKNQRIFLKNNSVLIIHPKDVHHFLFTKEEVFVEKYCLTFLPGALNLFQHKNRIAPFIQCNESFPHMLLFPEKEFLLFTLLLEEIREEFKQAQPNQELISINLTKLLFNLFRGIEKRGKNITRLVRMDPRITKSLDYIEENFRSPLSLKEASHTAGISDFHFSRLFTQSVGISFRFYLLSRRIEEAKKLLEETDKKILNVLYQSGFSDISAFNRNFKRHTGLTPGAYRQKYRKKKKSLNNSLHQEVS